MGRWDVQIAVPKNAHGCGNLTKTGGLERFIQHAWKEPDCAAVLILMDADEKCAKALAESLSSRVLAMGARCSVVTVIAKCEYEAWFLTSLETIAGQDLQGRTGLPAGLQYQGDVEALTGVKGWFNRSFPPKRAYKEEEDQAPMTRLLDIALARQRSRSFRRLCHALEEALEAMDSGKVVVTPSVTAVPGTNG